MKKKVLLILALIFITLTGCKKYESVVDGSIPDPPPIPFIPDNSWTGNGPFFVKASGNSLLFLFCNDYVASTTGSAFFEYKIGNGSWSAPISQAVPFNGQVNWGSGTIPVSIVIPEDALIYVRFGLGSTYADVSTSIFEDPLTPGIVVIGLASLH